MQEFLSLFVRWAHVVAAISWIGSSFYFMWLDATLKRRANMPDGVKGENWTVHGGGFYHTQKYMVAPAAMPDDLHWFKWESYATWMTGLVLLAIVYWWNASLYLVDPSKADLSPLMAVALSAAGLVGGWFVYDGLCRSPLARWPIVLFGVLFALITATAWAYGLVFSGRAAFLQTGAMMATAMSGNVFLVIIPNQRIVVRDLKAERTPDAKYGAIAKLRSTHNNYLTLPVLFLMLSNHYPATFSHPAAWVMVTIALVLGGIVRHFFNTYEAGGTGWRIAWQWPSAAVLAGAMVLFASTGQGTRDVALAGEASADATGGDTAVLDAMAFEIIDARCTACHADEPTWPGMSGPPGGVALHSEALVRRHRDAIVSQAVDSHAMPLGNITEMTDAERHALRVWASATAAGGSSQ